MLTLRSDPIELCLGGIIATEELLGDELEFLVLNARWLVGTLIQPVRLIDDKQIKVVLREPYLERRRHHLCF